jgi:hypothetical protein
MKDCGYTAKGYNPYFPYALSPSGGGLGGSKVKIMPVRSIHQRSNVLT